MTILITFVILAVVFFALLFLDLFYDSFQSNRMELFHFSRRLADHLSLGTPLVEAMEGIDETPWRSKRFHQALCQARLEVMKGSRLSRALSRQKSIFPRHFIKIIEMGEETGTLPDSLDQLANYYRDRYEIRKIIMGGLLTPLAVLLLTVGFTVFVIRFVIPTYQDIYEACNFQLPPMTRTALMVTNLTTQGISILVAVFITLALFCVVFWDKVKYHVDKLRFRLPFIAPLERLYEYTVFARALRLVVMREQSLDNALEFAASNITNRYFAGKIGKLSHSSVPTLSARLRSSGLFTPAFIWMVTLGEQSENLPETLKQLGDYYSEELDLRISRTVRGAEVFLTFILGLFIGFLAVTLFTPIALLACRIAEQIVAY